MELLEKNYPESLFGGFSDIDGTIVFYNRINALIEPKFIVLDVGCGRGAGIQDDLVDYRRRLRNLKGKCSKVIGIDVDVNGKSNPGIDEFYHLVEEATWPIADESIDLIVSDFVLEHVNQPQDFLNECKRVLKKNGYLCMRTTNRIGYVGLLSSVVPNYRHASILRFAQKHRKTMDVFPTAYKANTCFKIRKYLRNMNFTAVVYGYDAEPAYLRFSKVAYFLGKYIHHITPSFLKNCLFVFARKN